MAIVLHAADSADLGARAPKPTTTTPGQEEAALTVWQTEGGYHEVCQILSGRATVTETGGEPVEIGPGDTLVTPAGWTGVWEVHETLRKTYVVMDEVTPQG